MMRFSLWAVLFMTLLQCKQKSNDQLKANILFAVADDASYPHMSAYGTSWVKTPAFDRVAAEGILFNNCYTPNAKCAPSRACILTGRNSWQLEEAANHVPYFPAKFKTYAEALAENGYHVGYTAKGWAPGVALSEEGKKRFLTGKAYNEFSTNPPARHISNNDYSTNFEAFLDDNPEGKPFCFWYGSTEPHRAYEFGAGIAQGLKELTDIDQVAAFWPDNDTVRTDLLDYAFEIEYFDHHLQKMLQMLEKRGALDNTLVVVTADNGMPFPRIKGQAYELSNHLPLAIMWKKGIIHPGRLVDDFVSFIDFAPTFLEVAEVGPVDAGMQTITGRSLMDIFSNPLQGRISEGRDHVLIGKERHDVGRPHDWGYPIRGIVKNGYIFIQNYEPDRWPAGNPETGYLNTDGSPTKTLLLSQKEQPKFRDYWRLSFAKRPPEELYHIADDRDCMHNLAEDPSYANIKNSLQGQMVKELTSQGDPRMLGQGAVFDQYIYAGENVRGFYERYMAGEKIETPWVSKSDFQDMPIDSR
jgi:N-sulfoglucosamine sulfohydrolase